MDTKEAAQLITTAFSDWEMGQELLQEISTESTNLVVYSA